MWKLTENEHSHKQVYKFVILYEKQIIDNWLVSAAYFHY